MKHAGTRKPFHYTILETEFLGRSSRKFFYIGTKIFGKLANYFHNTMTRLPYVVKLDYTLSAKRITEISKYYKHLHAVIREFPLQPKISVVIPVYKVKPAYLEECLASIGFQVYGNWEVCIVDDCSKDPAIIKVIEDFSAKHPNKVKFSINAVNSHISITSNNCLELATGEYVSLLDHDDRLYPNSLAEVVRYINLHDGPDILYSDERTIDEHGNKLNWPYRKPGWSPFMHLSMNYTTHLSTYRRSLLREIGGFRKGFEGSQDHDLMLRAVEASKKAVVHIPFCLYQWRAHPQSTASSIDAKPYAAVAGEKAVREALERRGRPASVNYENDTMHYRLSFQLPNPLPLVSIVIPNKNSFEMIEKCVTSILEKSSYPNYEIIVVDNGSTDSRVRQLYESFAKKQPERFRFSVESSYFNFGKMVNQGVAQAKGEYVLLLNNDTSVIDGNWIEEMLGLAQFPEVGAVGAKLLFPDNSIQHAGILLTGHRLAEHAGIQLPEKHSLYCNLLNTTHECSAVSAACLLIKKSKYLEVGGLEEKYSPNGYGDVDFCLKLKKKGYDHLFTPYARLYHYESFTRGESVEYFERFYLSQRFGEMLFNDPYLNPNLVRGPNFQMDSTQEKLDLSATEFHYLLTHDFEAWA